MSLLYFLAGTLSGGTLGVVVGGVLATAKRADRQSEAALRERFAEAQALRATRERIAAWFAEPDAPVCVACRLGECTAHGTQRRNGGAS